MAKRLTDTEKWKDDWYISLSNDSKIVWQWLLDNCTHAGICKRSIGLLNMMCKVSLTEDQMVAEMSERVLVVNNLWFIPKFIKFQYTTLLSGKPAVVSVVKELFIHDCIRYIPEDYGNNYIIISKSFDNHYRMIKDMDKDTDMDKVKKGGVGENNNRAVKIDTERFEAIFSDGYRQKLGFGQKGMLEIGELKAKDVYRGLSN